MSEETNGVGVDMPFSEYREKPGVNASAIKKGKVSIKHMRTEMTRSDDEPTPAMVLGTMVHQALLEPEKFSKVISWEGDRRTKEWKLFEAMNAGATIIRQADMDKITRIREEVAKNPVASAILEKAIKNKSVEKSIFWSDQAYGEAKARIDILNLEDGIICDVKTAADITPEGFGRAFLNMAYDLQFGWYAECVKKQTGVKMQCCALAIESDEPFDVVVYMIPADVVEEARNEALEIASLYRLCESEGKFPGVVGGFCADIVLPKWSRKE